MRQLVLVLGLIAAASAAGCASPKFNACNYGLAVALGLDGSQGQPMFKNYTIMYNQLLYLFGVNAGSSDGPLKACNALEVFSDCSYNVDPSCLSVSNFAAGTDLQDAFFIMGTLTQYQFNCGPGLNTLFHEGLGCAQSILWNYQNTLQTCVAKYQISITNDPRNGCNYVNDLITCWSTPFYTAPCRRAEAADVWWSCEANKRFAYPQFPNCNIDCDAKLMALNQQNHIQTHFKVVDGEFWFKIPDYMDMVDGKLQKVEGPWMNN